MFGIFAILKSKTKQAILEGATEGVEELFNVKADNSDVDDATKRFHNVLQLGRPVQIEPIVALPSAPVETEKKRKGTKASA